MTSTLQEDQITEEWMKKKACTAIEKWECEKCSFTGSYHTQKAVVMPKLRWMVLVLTHRRKIRRKTRRKIRRKCMTTHVTGWSGKDEGDKIPCRRQAYAYFIYLLYR